MLLAMSLPEGCQSAERLIFRQLISGGVLSSLQLGARGNVNCSKPIARVTPIVFGTPAPQLQIQKTPVNY